jgi:hypothetical protein
MCVRVDETRHDGSLAEVNDLGSRGNLNAVRCANLSYFFAAYQHDLVGQHLTRLAVKQVTGTNCDHLGSLRRARDCPYK